MRRAGSLLLSPLVALLLATPFAGAALAQEFPSRPISIVVPFPPGGAVDSAARVLAAELAETSGKIFVVDNRAGGGNGVVGASEVVKSTPDGYTLLFNASIHVVTPLINKKVPYDVINDFTSIAGVAAGPLIISTPPSTKANTLKEFFAAVKANPDAFNFATSGYGSAGHLTIEFLKTQTGIDTDVVSYKGAGPALSDLMGGQVQLMADPMMSSLPHVRSGRLKALAVTSAKRSPLAPDVPTVAESGLPALEMLSWYAVWGPKNLDPKAAAYLSDAIAKVVKSDKFKEKLTVFGFEPMYMNGGELQAFVVSESKRYGDIVKAGNLKVD